MTGSCRDPPARTSRPLPEHPRSQGRPFGSPRDVPTPPPRSPARPRGWMLAAKGTVLRGMFLFDCTKGGVTGARYSASICWAAPWAGSGSGPRPSGPTRSPPGPPGCPRRLCRSRCSASSPGRRCGEGEMPTEQTASTALCWFLHS